MKFNTCKRLQFLTDLIPKCRGIKRYEVRQPSTCAYGDCSAVGKRDNQPLFNSALPTHLVVDHLPRLIRDVSRAGIASLLLKLTLAFAPSGSRARCASSCESLTTYFGIFDYYGYKTVPVRCPTKTRNVGLGGGSKGKTVLLTLKPLDGANSSQ